MSCSCKDLASDIESNIRNMLTLKNLFVQRLIIDSPHKDRRKRSFNQAIFDAESGRACFCNTDLDMVMMAFDNAMRDYTKIFCDSESCMGPKLPRGLL
jgi:hypothetical protein